MISSNGFTQIEIKVLSAYRRNNAKIMVHGQRTNVMTLY